MKNNRHDDFDMARWQAGGLSKFSQTCFAEYWDTLTVPKTVDPFNFSHRMALGKYLIDHTDDGVDSVYGSSLKEKHWFWGYVAQLDWQRRSGRFQDPQKWKDGQVEYVKEDKISEHSWWGYMNLDFSVAVYCGAAEAGIVPAIQMTQHPALEQEGFKKCVVLWKGFFKTTHTDFLQSHDFDMLYDELWPVHTNVINASLPFAQVLLKNLPVDDATVGGGWCNMVELLSATSWPLLSLESFYKFGVGYLPTVRLAGPKTLEWLQEQRPFEYRTVQSCYQLQDTPPRVMKMSCQFWARVAWFSKARSNMPRILHVLIHGNPLEKMVYFISVLTLAMFPHSWLEASVWGAGIMIILSSKS